MTAITLTARATPRSPTGARSATAPACALDPAALPRDRGERARRSTPSSPRASRSTASIPASASSPACASPTGDLDDAAAQPRPVACRRRRRADAGADRAADDGAEAREPRPRRLRRAAARPWRCCEAMLARGVIPVVPAQGSVGASGDLAPLAHHGGGDDRRRRGRSTPASACRPPRRSAAPGSRRSCSARRKGSRCSTARSSRPRRRWPACSRSRRVFQRGAGHRRAVDRCRARAPTRRSIARIHALRGHRGQIEAAAALRALMAGSAIRASHLVGDDRVQDPYCLRCQPQVMGAVLDLLRQAAATLAIEANGVTDNPLIFADSGEALSGGNFHAEPVAFAADMMAHRDLRDRLARRAAHRHAGRSGAVGPAGLPDAEARAEFRLHDRAGDGGGAGVREQAARLSRPASIRSRPPPTRRTTCRWRRMARAGCWPWPRTPRT